MKHMNKVILLGNMGKDPEVKYTSANLAIASFSLATSSSWKDKSGERTEKTEWHNVTVYGKLAEIVGEYFRKGDSLMVEGEIRYEEWEKDGVKRNATKIVATNIIQTKQGNRDGAPRQERAPQGKSKPATAAPPADPFNDEIPF
jgi:single-strand DNA-binding protein